jgi:hypothetical protein
MVAKPKLKLSICFPLVNITPHVIQTLKNLDTGNNSEYIFDIILSFNGVKSVPIFEVPINLKKKNQNPSFQKTNGRSIFKK